MIFFLTILGVISFTGWAGVFLLRAELRAGRAENSGLRKALQDQIQASADAAKLWLKPTFSPTDRPANATNADAPRVRTAPGGKRGSRGENPQPQNI